MIDLVFITIIIPAILIFWYKLCEHLDDWDDVEKRIYDLGKEIRKIKL